MVQPSGAAAHGRAQRRRLRARPCLNVLPASVHSARPGQAAQAVPARTPGGARGRALPTGSAISNWALIPLERISRDCPGKSGATEA
ncbi:UNVERIFIED_CONTAM: hypothetical protein Slati_3877900 [Sesamum latifolium]|uniref:Uncharacterized protein n=1 Tax=Sesamum latifolium TaxID=2727402 RepID=A0AAW2TL12_9LAMI